MHYRNSPPDYRNKPQRPGAPAPPESTGLLWLLFSFEGRVRRSVFWLVQFVKWVACQFIFVGLSAPDYRESAIMGFGWLVFLLLPAWISLAVAVKRFHDRDKSGWWLLIVLIPIFGPIFVMIEMWLMPGTDGPNRFGPDPRQVN